MIATGSSHRNALCTLALGAVLCALIAAAAFTAPAARAYDGNGAVSIGRDHTCALTGSGDESVGEFDCWGTDVGGDVDGPFGDLSAYRAVSVGEADTCAIAWHDDSLHCWGAADPKVSGPNGASGRFKAITAGSNHTCAIDASDSISCWGNDASGDVTAADTAPGRFKAVSAGDDNTCALASGGSISCWGDDTGGKTSLPDGAAASFKSVSTGADHTCAIDSGNSITCWGNNAANKTSSPTDAPGTFKEVSAGTNHTCAIDGSDSITCWGSESNGEVTDPHSWGAVQAVNAGDHSTCALRNTHLVCAGVDHDGSIIGPSGVPGHWGVEGPLPFVSGAFRFLNNARFAPAAAPLPGGRVLIAGGTTQNQLNFGGELDTADIYNVATDTTTSAASMNVARGGAVAAALPDGRVLVAGGYDGGSILSSAEIYDPVQNSWANVASMGTARVSAAAASLPGGDVLVSGGVDASFAAVSSTEIYDPGKDTWTPAASMSAAREAPAATALPDGRPFVVGGDDGVMNWSSAEFYGATADAWSASAPLPTVAAFAGATTVAGAAMIIGGEAPGLTDATWVRDPLSVHTKWIAGPPLPDALEGFGVATVDGAVVVAGGSRSNNAVPHIEVYKATDLSVAPTSKSFGSTPLAAPGVSQTFTVTSTGAEFVAIPSITPNGAGFYVSNNTCSDVISVTSTCTFTVRFQPTSPGAKTGTIRLDDDTLQGRHVIKLTGAGAGPVVAVSPSSHDFGAVTVGTTTAAKTFTVSNSGTGNLVVSKLSPNGYAGFKVASETCTGGPVTLGHSCTIDVTFKPSSAGAKIATLKVIDNSHAGYELIRLSGTGG